MNVHILRCSLAGAGGLNESVGHIHKLGRLKAGIYTAAATNTCGGGTPTGSCKHENLNARTFAQWGIDNVSSSQPLGL